MANATSKLFVFGLLAVLPVSAGDPMPGSGQKPVPDLVVYVAVSNLVTDSVLLQAEATATRMFAAIDVQVQWTTRRPRRSREANSTTCAAGQPKEIGVRMAMKKTASASREAFASTNPYATEDALITLFYSELYEATRRQPRLEPTVLAHVLVHELTHVLQGVARHSEAGVMRAHWTLRDYAAMERSPLEFTGEDADLVHLGLGKTESDCGRIGGHRSEARLEDADGNGLLQSALFTRRVVPQPFPARRFDSKPGGNVPGALGRAAGNRTSGQFGNGQNCVRHRIASETQTHSQVRTTNDGADALSLVPEATESKVSRGGDS